MHWRLQNKPACLLAFRDYIVGDFAHGVVYCGVVVCELLGFEKMIPVQPVGEVIIG